MLSARLTTKRLLAASSEAQAFQSRHLCRSLLTLAIESSCDDTAVSILEKHGNKATLCFNDRVTANNSAFQGIHPHVAHEFHQENLSALVDQSLPHLPDAHPKLMENEPHKILYIRECGEHGQRRAKQRPDFIAVTRGPGMRTNLSTGLDTAKGLATGMQIPLLGVHHMQAHALTPRLVSALNRTKSIKPDLTPHFPFLTLLVSGGHTLLLRSTGLTNHQILVNTDIAIGDCLDKIARAVLPPSLLAATRSVSYGALLESFAFGPNVHDAAANYAYTPPRTSGDVDRLSRTPSPWGWHFPSPFLTSEGGRKRRSMEYAFSGISGYGVRVAERGWDTAVGKMRKTDRDKPLGEEEARYLAREAMRVSFEHLASRVVFALEDEMAQGRDRSKTLVVGGGVAANQFLRHLLKKILEANGFGELNIEVPPPELCTDNAAMVAWAGCEMWEAGFRSRLDIRALRKWSLENLIHPEREHEAATIHSRLGKEDPEASPQESTKV